MGTDKGTELGVYSEENLCWEDVWMDAWQEESVRENARQKFMEEEVLKERKDDVEEEYVVYNKKAINKEGGNKQA